jgi:2-keto-4-pentenoate hydratase/2-oxohepta-3-ene-1,7-dioic acid hydratase in catechol pathway
MVWCFSSIAGSRTSITIGGKMKRYVRFQHRDRVSYGLSEGDVVRRLSGDSPVSLKTTEELLPVDEIELLAPCTPSKVVAVGRNYRAHAEEFGSTVPEEPILFLKPSTSVIGPDAPIRRPKISNQVEYEAELAVVIGKTAWEVPEGEAASYIWGYSCLNDVTARDLQHKDAQWARSKGFDTFCPIGPWIVTDIDVGDLTLEGVLNGEVKQRASTADLVFSVAKLIAFITQVMTLLPGDVIATGSPSGLGALVSGDRFAVRIEKIGVLENPVV